MDVDALAVAHGEEWARLDELSRSRRLDGAGIDELVTRYRAASVDLAEVKSVAGRSPISDRLSLILSRTRLRLTGVREPLLRAFGRFFLAQLPAAAYRILPLTVAVAVAFTAIAVLVGWWVASDPALLATLGSAADLQRYAEQDFTSYYTENPAAVFAGTVWTNNAWIAAQCVMFGVTGIWPVYVVMQNAVSIGVAGAVMAGHDRLDVFFAYILPHGLLELTCIFFAAAAGLRVFWAWVAPGPRSRGEALAREGRALSTVAIGLVFALALAGIVEGFVTGQPWPWPVKLLLGAAALSAVLAFVVLLGGPAYRRGERGDLAEYEAGARVLVAG